MAYLLAIGSAVFYGAADFIGGMASRRTSAIATVVLSQFAGLVLVALVLPFLWAAAPGARDLFWGAVSGLTGGIGVALLYRALAVATVSIVAPTTAVCAVLIPVLADVAFGERPTPWTTIGIVLAVVAIVLVSQAPSDAPDRANGGRARDGRADRGRTDDRGQGDGEGDVGRSDRGQGDAGQRHDGRAEHGQGHGALRDDGPRHDGQGDERTTRESLMAGLRLALASGVGIGLFYLSLARASPDAGLWPLLMARVVSVTLFTLLAFTIPVSLKMARPVAGLAVFGGTLDMLANVLYLLAVQRGSLSVVVTLASLYPASTVMLARIVLDERLGRWQSVGIVCALAAVVLIVGGTSP